MRRLLTITVALFLTHQAAHAANISVVAEETSDHPALILIEGEFLKDEVQKDVGTFMGLVAVRKKSAVVFLKSQGGLVSTGLQIGRLIRQYGYSTVVADDTQCSSSCALAWMGGKERYMGATARIGFHAARRVDNSDVSPSANAVIGAYLYEIGVTDFRAITYLTNASPQSMTWLTIPDAIRHKIAVKAFSFSQDEWSWARAALVAKPREPTEVKVAAPLKVPVPVPAKRPSQTAIATRSPSRCEGTEAHVDSEIRCLKPKDTFKDCPECPEMVVVPAGEFMMGSPASEAERFNDEGPQRTVRIAWFAVGKFEILFAEWDACVTAGGCKHRPEDQGWGRGRRPVINVSWDDITRDYVPWLSRKTGKTYRLLTEAEWEYAARAGTTTPFSMGWTITTDQANFDGNYTYGGNSKGQNRRRTVEVGSYQPNALGIHDMHGNVWEWVQDCYKDSYLSAPWDGSALADAPGCSRVLRGGSWINDPGNLRSANRIRDTPVYRDIYVGFRLARALGISNDERQLLPRTDSRLRSVPYGARPATSVVRCIEICRMEPKCQAFEFYANMETCWLQDGFTGYFETRGWHAGAKSTQ